MTTLYCDDNGRAVQVIKPNYAKIQNVSVSGTSAPTTNGAPHGCTLLMIVSTTDCWIKAAASPTAAKDNTSIFVPAKCYFYHAVAEGDKVAFIQDSASGTAQVIPAI
jgi:hypothetical protein